jgi:hypothetical protein
MKRKQITKSWPKKPRKFTEEVIGKLEEGFKSDFTVKEACSYAWIAVDTYYEHYKKNKSFSDRMDSAEDFCFIMAKNNVRKWLNEGDKEYSLKRLKNRQNKRYSERNEGEGEKSIKIEGIKIEILK